MRGKSGDSGYDEWLELENNSTGGSNGVLVDDKMQGSKSSGDKPGNDNEVLKDKKALKQP